MNREAMEVREVSQGYDLKAAKLVVPEGYKQTEVGVIPEHWSVAPLRQEVAKLEAGVSVNSVDENLGSYSHELSVLKTSSVADGRFYSNECKKIAPTDLSRVSLSPRADTLLVSRMNTPDLVGECGYVDKDFQHLFLPDRLWMTQKHVNSKASFRWLSYLLSSKPQKSRIKGLATGTSGSMKNISKDSLLDTLLPFPPPEEQEAIATALSDVDALLEELDRLIAKKRDIKQATMQQLLTGQTRLPGFEGEWETMSLGYFGRCLRGVSYDGGKDLRPYDTGETIRLLRANNVKDAEVVDVDIQYVSAERVSAQQIMQEDDILICMANGSKGLVGKAGFFRRNHSFTYTFGAFMGCFRTDDTKADPGFIFLLFQTYQYREYINLLLAGSSINNLRPSSIELMDFQFPSMEEQKAIASMLQDIGSEVEVLEKRRAKIIALKQAMMQELLTGRVRLL